MTSPLLWTSGATARPDERVAPSASPGATELWGGDASSVHLEHRRGIGAHSVPLLIETLVPEETHAGVTIFFRADVMQEN